MFMVGQERCIQTTYNRIRPQYRICAETSTDEVTNYATTDFTTVATELDNRR